MFMTPSSPLRMPTRLSLLTLTLSGVLGLSACGSDPKPPIVMVSRPLMCPVDPALRERLPRPPLPKGPPTSIAAVTAFSVAQEADLSVAQGRLDEAVGAIDNCNQKNGALAETLEKIKS